MSKTSVQLAPGPGQAMMTLENDYNGADFSASIKAMNPSILDGGLTGIFVGSYLQSITPQLSLGLEGVWQRAAVSHGPDMLVSYAARYKTKEWIASAQLLAQGGVQASYWRRLAERVEAGVDVNLQFVGMSGMAGGGGMMGGGMKNDGVATFGAKYDFRASSYRAQVDSQGKVACLLEKRVAPAVNVSFSGEVDHPKVSLSSRVLTISSLKRTKTNWSTCRTKPRWASLSQLKLLATTSWNNKKGPAQSLPHHSKLLPGLMNFYFPPCITSTSTVWRGLCEPLRIEESRELILTV